MSNMNSTTSTTSSVPSGTCVAGTGPGNYVGLCSFSCNFGYCPAPCTCSSYAATGNSAPPVTNTPGYPLSGEDPTTYSDLCNFTCNHGYCPPTACTYNSDGSPISSSSTPATTTITSKSTTTSAVPSGTSFCVAGTGPGNYIGLCNFCCGYSYCPPGPCTCTKYANMPIAAPPASSPTGKPLQGEDDSYLGLCAFSCSHGYCPGTACASG